jgi:hypothetical protein
VNHLDVRPTLDAVIERLEPAAGRPGIDILYLVCHGLIDGGEPRLLLERPDGTADEVSAAVFAERVARLPAPPTIAALCSCQSAGSGDLDLRTQSEPLAPFGPLLARAGVPIVLAMQGNVTMSSAANFLSTFFEELEQDGLPDRAASEARRRIDRRPDWWMPVLFSRLRRGRPWYEPRFGPMRDQKLRDIWKVINEGQCVVVIGSGIAGEVFLPQRHEFARSWVERRQMPINTSVHNDLAKVAQFLSVDSGPGMPHAELSSFVRAHLRSRFADQIPGLDWNQSLPRLITEVGAHHRSSKADDPYRILAGLRNVRIYVTTSWTSLLEDALADADRPADVRSFDWLRDRRLDDDTVPEPTTDRPLVYHLFGRISEPSSVVLTEDDYFTWLTKWARHANGDKAEFIPGPVERALTDASSLLLGFSLDDWEFRIVLHSIKAFAGSPLRDRHQHLGVQLRPETSTIEPEAALDYLERYLGNENVQVYWGSSGDFLKDLAVTEPRP